MYSNNDKISTSQMVFIIILTMVGIGILTLPRDLIEEVGLDGWLVLILGGGAAIAVSFVHGYIIKSFPGKSYFEILSLTLTKPIAYIVGIYTLIYLIVMTGYVVRVFSMVTKESLLPRTPFQLVLYSVLLISIYLVRQGVEVLARVADIIFIPLFMMVLGLLAISWGGAEASNLLPILQTPSVQILQGIPFALFAFLGFEILLILGRSMADPAKSTRVGPIAISITVLIYLILNASVLMVLGIHQTEHLIWPLLNAFRTIELPGAFIENVDVFVMSVWVFAVFMTIVPFHLGSTLLIMELVGGKEHNYYGFLPVPFIACIAIWDDSIAEVYESIGQFIDYTAYGVVILVPLGILLSMMIRGNKKKKDNPV